MTDRDVTDRDAAVAVWRAANAARGKAVGPARVDRVRAKLADPDALLVLVRANGCAAGMALGEPGRDDDGAGPVQPGECHLSMVFVHPEHQGAGVGRALLAAFVERAAARGWTGIGVWTGSGNARALRLYRSGGFRDTGRRAALPSGELIVRLERAVTGLPRSPRG